MTNPSRRSILEGLGGVATASLAGQTTLCSVAVESAIHRVQEAFLYGEYLVVTVATRAPGAPRLRVRVEGCDRTETRYRGLTPGTEAYECGPFGHRCVDEYEVWLDGYLSV